MKRFKYLFFTNKLNHTLYNFWFFKKLTAGGDDGNLLSQPTDYTSNGIEWKWSGMKATGSGKASSGTTIMNETISLKDNVVTGETYTFSIKNPLTKNLRVYLISEGGTKVNYLITAGETSRLFIAAGTFSSYYLQYHCTKGEDVNVIIEDIKLIKVS